MAPLQLIHSDLYEMNRVLTKGGKRYFMTLIDDSTRFCYIYLLKSKENQLERKIKRVRSDRGGEYFSNLFTLFMRNMVLFMRGRLPIHLSQMGLPKERTAL